MNFDELAKYALLFSSVVSGWMTLISDKKGRPRKIGILLTATAVAALFAYLAYRDFQSARTILVAHYPGYHFGVKPKDLSNVVYVTAPSYAEVEKGVRDNRKADVFILSSGIYARLLKNAATSGIDDLKCFVADQQKKGGDVDRYQPVLLLNNHCPNFDAIRDRPNEALQTLAADIRNEESRRPGSMRNRILFVDPFSASGFYVPVQELGLADAIRREPGIRCAASHKAAIRAVSSSAECMMTPTNLDELEDTKIVDGTGTVIDNAKLALVHLKFHIPRSPHCVRSRFFGGEQAFFQKTFEASKLTEPVPDKYLELYDDYIQPAPQAQCAWSEGGATPTMEGGGDAPARPGVKLPAPRLAGLYVDLDGTLLKPLAPGRRQVGDSDLEPVGDDSFGLNRRDLEALQAFTACGGRIGFATGRTFSQIPQRLLDLKPQLPFVLANGGVIQNAEREVCASWYLGSGAARQLVSLASQFQDVAAVVLQSASDNFLIRTRDDDIAAFLRGGQLEAATCNGVDDTLNCARLSEQRERLVKVMFVARAGVAADLANKIAARLHRQFSISTGGGTTDWMSIEINQANASKYAAIEAASRIAHLDSSDLVVFGDGRNDLSMLKGVGVSFALSYSPQEVQSVAMATASAGGDPMRTNQVGRIVERLLLPGCSRSRSSDAKQITRPSRQ